MSAESKARSEYGITCYQGKAFLPHFSWECVKYAFTEWKMPENSVIISSYIKTGTAWCLEIMRQILCGRDDDLMKAVKSIPIPIYLLESGTPKKFEQYSDFPVKVFMTHAPADLFNFAELKRSNSKVIYMHRNPKDQAVSWYHFSNKISSKELKESVLGKDWNEFFAKYTAGEHPTGMAKGEWYPDHVKAWMNRADTDKNVLPVEYESLKKDFPTEIRRIAKFIGIELTDRDVTRITERCTIEAMKAGAADDKTGFLKVNVRKGDVGGWKDQFTVSQSEFMDKLIDEKMAETGIKFTYEL